MDLSFKIDTQDQEAFAVLILVNIAYLAFHYGVPASRWQNILEGAEEKVQARSFYLQRLLGGLILGLLPLAIISVFFSHSLADNGLGLGNIQDSAKWIVGTLAVVLPVVILNAKKEDQWQNYPQVRHQLWNRHRFLTNGFTWIVYLIGYEIFFRGLLLFSLVRWCGPWPAMAINTLFYVGVHLPKDANECIGTLPMGFLFCFMTLQTQSILAPLLIHIVIALSSDYFAVRNNPAFERA